MQYMAELLTILQISLQVIQGVDLYRHFLRDKWAKTMPNIYRT